jgi:large subunit ribosomal protein L37Ae
MATKTKKVGSAGRFGSKYGKKIRDNVKKIELRSKTKHKCPQCEKLSLKRKASGIWECSKCGAKMAGGAWSPQTELGRVSTRVVTSGTKGKAAVEEMEAAEEEEE